MPDKLSLRHGHHIPAAELQKLVAKANARALGPTAGLQSANEHRQRRHGRRPEAKLRIPQSGNDFKALAANKVRGPNSVHAMQDRGCGGQGASQRASGHPNGSGTSR